jgi:hypothetical protein
MVASNTPGLFVVLFTTYQTKTNPVNFL